LGSQTVSAEWAAGLEHSLVQAGRNIVHFQFSTREKAFARIDELYIFK
jgi:hypothetical protein